MAKVKNQLDERVCPECGRRFIFRDQWAYKLIKNKRVVNYCSWTCMRKNERKKENGRTEIRAEQTADAVPDADAVPGAAPALGMDASAVDDAGKEMIASYWMQQDERSGKNGSMLHIYSKGKP